MMDGNDYLKTVPDIKIYGFATRLLRKKLEISKEHVMEALGIAKEWQLIAFENGNANLSMHTREDIMDTRIPALATVFGCATGEEMIHKAIGVAIEKIRSSRNMSEEELVSALSKKLDQEISSERVQNLKKGIGFNEDTIRAVASVLEYDSLNRMLREARSPIVQRSKKYIATIIRKFTEAEGDREASGVSNPVTRNHQIENQYYLYVPSYKYAVTFIREQGYNEKEQSAAIGMMNEFFGSGRHMGEENVWLAAIAAARANAAANSNPLEANSNALFADALTRTFEWTNNLIGKVEQERGR